MGFVKFARVFRFIGLFLGLNVLAYGLILMFIDKIPGIEDTLAQSAQGTGYTIEELLKTWKSQGLVIAIVGGALMLFGIICFIIFGVNKWKLESSSSSSSYNSNTSNYSSSEPTRQVTSNSYNTKSVKEYETKYRKGFEAIAEAVSEYFEGAWYPKVEFQPSDSCCFKVIFTFYCYIEDRVNQKATDGFFEEISAILSDVDERASYLGYDVPKFEIRVGTKVK